MKGILLLSLLISAPAQTQRVILTGEDVAKVKKEMKKTEVTKVKANQESFELTPAEVKTIKSKYPKLKVEEDVVFSLPPVKMLGKPSAGTVQPAQVVPWGIQAVRAHLASNQGQGVKVCVVDTGVDKSHPDLPPSSRLEAYGVPGLRNQSNDDNGHGTHVSGTIAAQNNSIGVVGVAPMVNLMSVKALNRQGSGYSSDLANAIDLCVSKGARVISASWGSAGYSSVIADAVVRATSRGVYFVAAAGNESTRVSYPAALSQSIAISAVDSNMNFAYFSNFGLEVDYTAPGVNVLSTLPGGKYQSWNGTSMATPHAAGVIALMFAAGKTEVKTQVLALPVEQQGQGLVDGELSSY